MKIAFLDSIYPEHVEQVYKENPNLKNNSSEEQVEFIRWHALSSYVRWFEILENRGFETCTFNSNLNSVNFTWAKENNYKNCSNNNIWRIGIEKIKRFNPDMIFVFTPSTYIENNFLTELVESLNTKPKLVAWYGANCGSEKIFRYFSLTLSNSKQLVQSLREKEINSEYLQHSFDPIILDNIQSPKKKINKTVFFGNLDYSSDDFQPRTELLQEIASKTKSIDIYGALKKPTLTERFKNKYLDTRHEFSKSVSNFIPLQKLQYWSDKNNLPTRSLSIKANFARRVKAPLYGKEMLQKLSKYKIALNYHNAHTGNYACNMRLFEATGLGCCLLTDNKSDLKDFFTPEKEVITYNNLDELEENINYLIKNPKICNEISKLGQKRCLQNHSTDKVLNRFIEILNSL
jgi:spore maturation protein CgeB